MSDGNGGQARAATATSGSGQPRHGRGRERQGPGERDLGSRTAARDRTAATRWRRAGGGGSGVGPPSEVHGAYARRHLSNCSARCGRFDGGQAARAARVLVPAGPVRPADAARQCRSTFSSSRRGRASATWPDAGPAFWRSVYLALELPCGLDAHGVLLAGRDAGGVARRRCGTAGAADRVGLRTPARGYLITGLVVVVLALVIPLCRTMRASAGWRSSCPATW